MKDTRAILCCKLLFAVAAAFIQFVLLSPDVSADAKDDVPKYALLIGLTKYKSTQVNEVDGCENNVPLLATTLIDSYGFRKENVRILLNDKATKEAILGGFRSHLIENARSAKNQSKEAVIVYYFCGHGSQYPDQDGDENDGLDETFVAYDSRTGNVPDILDDEIDDLKAELRPFTTNTTLILESCHSGTGSRNGDLLISQQAPAEGKKHPPYKRRHPPTRDEDALTYTEIAASASENTAKSESKAYCNCEKPYSLMTKALVEALNRANNSTTYRSLVQEVAAVVALRSRQDPQVEGNRDALLFGGAAKRARPYIEIERMLDRDRLIIKAGAVHGLRTGSQVAIYSSAAVLNAGDKEWLTNGLVTEVRDFQSIVQLPAAGDSPGRARISLTSRVVLTSPIFGGGPVLLSLDMEKSATRIGPLHKEIVDEIKKQLRSDQMIENELVTLVDAVTPLSLGTARGSLRLKRDKFINAFPSEMRRRARMPKATKCRTLDGREEIESPPPISPESEVYYLEDGVPGNPPLFGKFFPADVSSAPEIARVIRNYVLRTNLESLDNAASTLPTGISVEVRQIKGIPIVEECRDGRVTQRLGGSPAASNIGAVTNGKVPVGSIFNFKVKNVSGELRRKKDPYAAGERLYITALYLLNNGDIDVIYPRLGARDALADGIERTFGGYIASKPAGAEQLIVIVSRSFVDLSFYASMTVSRRPQSQLERLLKQSGTKTRDSATLIPDEPDSWGVIRVNLDVVE